MLSFGLGLLSAYIAAMLLIGWASLRGVRTPIFFSPDSLGVGTEPVEFESPHAKRKTQNPKRTTLRGWWIHHADPRAVCILLHGYIMNRGENSVVGVEMNRLGFACLSFDFRACGRSGGNRTGIGWLERHDVLAAAALARQRYPGKPIVLLGSSMGAAAAAFAHQHDPDAADALILDCGYNRLTGAVLGWWRFIGGKLAMYVLSPTALLCRPFAGFNPLKADVGKALQSHSKPVLILHGDRDTLVRPSHAEANFKAAQKPGRLTRLKWFEGCNHAEMRWTRTREFIRTVDEFLQEAGI